MRECKKCKLVKFDSQMYKEVFSCPYGSFKQTTWLCKKCAKDIGEKAVKDYLKIKKD